MRSFFIIMGFVLGCFLLGCRAKMESKARTSHTSTEEIGVELRRVDSLWSSIAERLNCKIEFYPLTSEYSGWPIPTSDTAAKIGHSRRKGHREDGGGVGAIKSIEFSMEHDAQSSTASQVDSSYKSNTTTTETLQEQKASEARQDNGTVATVSIVAAVALLFFFILKTYLKK